MALVTVQMEDWELLEMLLERCDAWGTSKDNKDLFEIMYQSYIDCGVFEHGSISFIEAVSDDEERILIRY